MKSLKQLLVLIFILFISCKQEYHQVDINVLNITKNGDSIENGLWIYDTGKFGVISRGNFLNGMLEGKWTYKLGKDSIKTIWNIYKVDSIKFSFPDKYELIDTSKLDYPLIFQAKIIKDDKNTHFSILKHKLEDADYAAYEYLLLDKEEIMEDPNTEVLSMNARKYIFKNIDIFKLVVDMKQKEEYKFISYIFIVGNYLYDFVYKNQASEVSNIEFQIFDEILYSIECNGIDLFTYNTRHYLDEEEIILK